MKAKNQITTIDIFGGRSLDTLTETEFDQITSKLHLNYSGIIAYKLNYYLLHN
jgi:hypothetical protein